MNIAFEISPLITASGTFGDKSGVYRYMYGLLSSLVAIMEKKDKNAKIILFSFNRDIFRHTMSMDILSLLNYKNVILLNTLSNKKEEIEKDPDENFFLELPIIRSLAKWLNNIFQIRLLYINYRNKIRFLKHLHSLTKTFKKHRVKIIFHSETGFHPLQNFKNITTVYDLTTIFASHFHREETIDLQKRKIKFARKHCDGILCISRYTKKDLIRYSEEFKDKKIMIAYPGVDPIFQTKTANNKSEKLEDINSLIKAQRQKIKSHYYLLYYGTFEPRKNIAFVVRAFADLQKNKEISSDFKLVLCGGAGWGNIKQMTLNYINENFPVSKKNNIVVLDYLNDDYIIDLIQNAYCVIYPSLYEGFGLPVLESMALGTPVITGNNSSLPEVGGQAVLYVDSTNFIDIKNKIKQIVNNQKLAHTLSKKGIEQSKKFRWEKTASKLYSFLHEL